MDQESFDRIARLLGGTISRRRGFGVGAALAALAGGAIAPSAEAKHERGGGRAPGATSHKPKPAGPCGSGKVADNRCRKDSECCTNICKLKNKGKDGSGRCRCQRKNKPCTEDRNCCSAAGQQMTCIDGHCGFGTSIPTGEPCRAGKDTCADENAACVDYQLGTPTGTYCLLPDGAPCESNGVCESDKCTAGTCGSNCTVCRVGCPYTKIADAVAGEGPGSTILIAPGGYDTYVNIDSSAKDNQTLVRCGSRGDVRWASYSGLSVIHVGEYTLNLRNLTLFGYYGAPTYNLLTMDGTSQPSVVWSKLNATDVIFENMTGGDSYGTVQMNYYADASFTNCTFRFNASNEHGGGISIEGAGDTPPEFSKATINNCTFYRNQAGDTYATPDTYGGAIYSYRGATTITNSTFEGNSGKKGGAIFLTSPGTMTITDSLIKGNTSTDGTDLFPGGGIYVQADSGVAPEGVSLTLAGTTKISGNVGNQGSGIAVVADDPSAVWSVTGASGRVVNNIGAPDQCAVSTDGETTWSGVANCVF